jgi:hypothetical protein
MNSCIEPSSIICKISGASDIAGYISNLLMKFKEQDINVISYNWRAPVETTVVELYNSNNSSGWDGYDAHPISIDSTLAARNFLQSLPDWVMPPDVVPEPTGDIAFEWSKNDVDFSISFRSNKLIYAGILGTEKSHGEIKLLNEISPTILQILSQYFTKN